MGRLGAKKNDDSKKKNAEVIYNLIGKDDVKFFYNRLRL